MVPVRHHAITWSNADQGVWSHIASLVHILLNHSYLFLKPVTELSHKFIDTYMYWLHHICLIHWILQHLGWWVANCPARHIQWCKVSFWIKLSPLNKSLAELWVGNTAKKYLDLHGDQTNWNDNRHTISFYEGVRLLTYLYGFNDVYHCTI